MSDLISRQATIEAMWEALYVYQDLAEIQFAENDELDLSDWFQHRIFVQRMHDECVKVVESIPSAERPTGKWVKISPARIYECSVCGQTVMTDDIDCYSYCHNCGAKMEVEE